MASTKAQQPSSVKKLLFIAVPLIGIIFLIPTGPTEKKGPSKTQQLLANAAGKSSSKKEDPYNTKEDINASFERVDASLKNSFVPLVTKRDVNGPTAPNGIPSSFADGEGTWTYTGNMTVNGTPNALLENSATGEGVFLRPNQHWKKLKLVSVREDSIVIEGPAGEMKTVYFNDPSLVASPEALAPLPPVFQNNGAATQVPNNGGGGFGRPQRGANRQSADNSGGLSGPIGQQNAFEPSIESQDQSNDQFNNRRNRNRSNQ